MYRKLLYESQFHGGRLLVEKKYGWCWDIVLILLFCASVFVVKDHVERFYSQPTQIARVEYVTEVMEHPSIIFCPESKYSDEKIKAFLDTMIISPDTNRTYLIKCVQQLPAFFSSTTPFSVQDLIYLENFLDFNNVNVYEAGLRLSYTCEEILLKCHWRNFPVDCMMLFRKDLTGNGFCCVFNTRSLRRDHTHDEIWTTLDSGIGSGLSVAINEHDRKIGSIESYKKILLETTRFYHESLFTNGSVIMPGNEVWIPFWYYGISINVNARSMTESMIRCRWSTQRLEFYPSYTRANCLMECEMHRALEACNCTAPTHPPHPHAMYCRADKIYCLKKIKVSYDNEDCNCLYTCDTLQVETRMLSNKLEHGSFPLDSLYQGLNVSNTTIVRIYRSKNLQIDQEKRAYISDIDFVAQIGGIFNCFFGCSFMTVLELWLLVYYGYPNMVLRVTYWWNRCNKALYGRNTNQTATEDTNN